VDERELDTGTTTTSSSPTPTSISIDGNDNGRATFAGLAGAGGVAPPRSSEAVTDGVVPVAVLICTGSWSRSAQHIGEGWPGLGRRELELHRRPNRPQVRHDCKYVLPIRQYSKNVNATAVDHAVGHRVRIEGGISTWRVRSSHARAMGRALRPRSRCGSAVRLRAGATNWKTEAMAEKVRFTDVVPYDTPSSIAALRGPEAGSIELPLSVYWGPARSFDLADPHDLRSAYQALVREGSSAAQEQLLNAELLQHVWSSLRLPQRCRNIWETRFPVLRSGAVPKA
jgi:hypothetical protein